MHDASQYQQVCFVESHKIMSLTWKERVTDHSIYFTPSVVKSNKSDLKIMNQFMFLAWGIAGALNVLFFMETPWNNIFLFLPFFCFSSHFSGVHEVMFIMIRPAGHGGHGLSCDGWGCLCRYRFVKHIPQPSCVYSHRPSPRRRKASF